MLPRPNELVKCLDRNRNGKRIRTVYNSWASCYTYD